MRTNKTRYKSRRKMTRKQILLTRKQILLICGIIIAVLLIAGAVALYQATHHERISVEGYQHNSRFDGWLVVEGIDVSYVQGEIDWKKVKNSGVDFAFIRAGFRDTGKGNLHTDDYYEQNIKHAIREGVMTGVYFFSQATTKEEAREEANYVLELVDGYDITLPIVMDYEEYGDCRLSDAINSGKLTYKKMTNICKAFTSVIEAAGYESAVYGNYSMLTYTINGASLGNTTNIWTAQYNYESNFKGPYRFWQCTDSMTVPGIEGYVDLNFMYLDASGVWESTQYNPERTSISECKVKIKDKAYRYFGHRIEPRVVVRKGLRRLREGRDYTVSYVKNTSPGTGYAIISGIGKYKDTVVYQFEIKKVI